MGCNDQLCIRMYIIITITACPTQLFAILLKTATLLFLRNFTQDWLNYNWLLPSLSGPFIYALLQSAEHSQSRRFMFSPSRELYREIQCMCILILVWPACLVLLVYLEGVSCISVHTNCCCVYFCCVCVFYLFHTHGLGYCSFCLLFTCEIFA